LIDNGPIVQNFVKVNNVINEIVVN